MITDDELAQWTAMLSAKVTLRTHADRMADARRQKELATAAESAFPRLIAEVERLREYEADCETYEKIFRHVLKYCPADPALGAAAKVALYFESILREQALCSEGCCHDHRRA